MTTLILVFLGSMTVAWWLTGRVRVWAETLRLVDVPDNRRKTQDAPVPLGGGLGVLAGVLAMGLAAATFESAAQELFLAQGRFFVGLAVAATAIAGVGLLDDRHNLRGRQKLLAQAAVSVAFVLGTGISIARVEIFQATVEFGVFATPITVLWLLFAVNAFNLIDGVDGLAGTLGAIISLALATLCIIGGRWADAAVCVALAGGLVGFLKHNFPPAKIYLGDTGSMLIGFLIGALGLHASQKTAATVALTTPLALLSIPFFDSLAAIVRRKLTGRSIYCTDRGHLHHCLLRKTNGSASKTLLIAGCACALTCLAALGSVWFRSEVSAALGVLVVLAALILTGLFGQTESLLVAKRVRSFGLSLLRPRGERRDRESAYAVQGCPKACEGLWRRMRAEAAELGVLALRLEVDVPRRHLQYVSEWQNTSLDLDAPNFELAMPLLLDGAVVGRVEVTAPSHRTSAGRVAECVAGWDATLADIVRTLDAEALAKAVRAVRTPKSAGSLSNPDLVAVP